MGLSHSYAEAFDIELNIIGGKPNKGQFLFSIFNSKESFLKKPLLEKNIEIDKYGNGKVKIESLPKGTYAVSIVYDENSDNKLNTNFFGIPTEKVGFSNNAKGRLGPPSFEDTSFLVNKNLELEVSVTSVKK